MSYILDALVKADRERQQRAVPGLHTVQMAAVAPAARRAWPLAAGAAALAAAFGAGLFLAGNRPGPAAVSSAPAPVAPAGTAAPEVPAALPATAPAAPAVRPAQAATSAASEEGAPRPAASGQRVLPPVSQKTPLPRENAVRSERTADREGPRPEPSPGSRLYGIAELPPALRKEAQGISVAGFAQATDAEERLAIINNRALREGDEVTTGLRVERISKDGVIFNLKGYRFMKGGA